MSINDSETLKSGKDLLEEVAKDLFHDTPELIDITLEIRKGTVEPARFHIKEDSYEGLLDYSNIEISEYLNKFGPITPNSLDWDNSINHFDLLDLKKNTEFYIKLRTFNEEVIWNQEDSLKDLLGDNKKIVFDGKSLTISDL